MKKHNIRHIIKFIIFISIIVIICLTPSLCINMMGEIFERKEPAAHYDPDKPTEFFLIVETISERNIDEWYVIANAPLDMPEIIKIVEDYNRRTINVDMIKTNNISRYFYRENEFLTRNYLEGAPYPKPAPYYGDDPGQQLRYHSILISVTNYQAINSNSTYWSYYYYGLEERIKNRIDDINEYFIGGDGALESDR